MAVEMHLSGQLPTIVDVIEVVSWRGFGEHGAPERIVREFFWCEDGSHVAEYDPFHGPLPPVGRDGSRSKLTIREP